MRDLSFNVLTMSSKFLLFLVFLWNLGYQETAAVKATAGNDHVKLMNKLFANYRREFLPRVSLGEPVNVSFKFELINIKDVNAREQSITIYGWIDQKWLDPHLGWNSSEFGGVKEIQVSSHKIWAPDILLYNNVDERDHTGGGPSTYKTDVVVQNDGRVNWPSPALFKAICTIDVTDFPFDSQVCRLKFGSWTHSSSNIQMFPFNIVQPTRDYMASGEWRVIKILSERNVVHYQSSNKSYDDVTVSLEIGRNYFNYCVNLIIPCFLISCMIFLSFILPPETGERVGLSITVLLAMTVFQQLTSSIFPSFDFPLLGQYYFATSMEISLSLIATAIVINFSFRRHTKMPRWVRKLFLEWLSRLVRLRDTVNNSRPKPRQRQNSVAKSKHQSRKNKPKERETSTATPSQRPRAIHIQTPPTNGDMTSGSMPQRREDRLVEEFKNVLSVSHLCTDISSFNFSQHREVNGSYNQDVELEGVGIREVEENDVELRDRTQPVVLGENGERLSEEELTLREWEWSLAARILDRLFMWVAVLVGVTTVFAIFLRASSLQRLFGLTT